MTDLTNILTDMVAERDGIHPAHAANRVNLAIHMAEIALTNGQPRERHFLEGWPETPEAHLEGEWLEHTVRVVMEQRGIRRRPSDATIALARQIVG